MRISDWSSDVCSSDLRQPRRPSARYGRRTNNREREPWSLGWLLCRCDFPSRVREGGLLFRVDEDDFGVVDRGDGDGLAARQRRTVAGIEANAVALERARRGAEIGVPPLADAVRQE